jgi:hypothetical protein
MFVDTLLQSLSPQYRRIGLSTSSLCCSSSPTFPGVCRRRPARLGQEFVSIDDYHSMITMLHIAARDIDTTLPESTEQLMERLYAERSFVLTRSRRDP